MKRISVEQRIRDVRGLRFAREARCDCCECQDMGWVTIWHPQTVQQARRNPDECDWSTVVVRCSCNAAGHVADQFRAGPPRGNDIPVFGERSWHINAHHPDAKAMAAMSKPENYNEALAAFDKSA